jgi:hypothetical protein
MEKGPELRFQDEEPTSWWKPMFDATSPSDLTDDLSPFGSPEVRGGKPSDKDLQRAEGFGRAVLSGSEKGSRIVDIFNGLPFASCSRGPAVVR